MPKKMYSRESPAAWLLVLENAIATMKNILLQSPDTAPPDITFKRPDGAEISSLELGVIMAKVVYALLWGDISPDEDSDEAVTEPLHT